MIHWIQIRKLTIATFKYSYEHNIIVFHIKKFNCLFVFKALFICAFDEPPFNLYIYDDLLSLTWNEWMEIFLHNDYLHKVTRNWKVNIHVNGIFHLTKFFYSTFKLREFFVIFIQTLFRVFNSLNYTDLNKQMSMVNGSRLAIKFNTTNSFKM